MVEVCGVGACCTGGAAESLSTCSVFFPNPSRARSDCLGGGGAGGSQTGIAPAVSGRAVGAPGPAGLLEVVGRGWVGADRAGRLTGRFSGRLLLGCLCLLIRRLLIRRLLRLRRAATCGASGSRAARLRWTNRSAGSLRSAAATSSSCAARTRRCNLLFAAALPVGTLVLLVRSLPGRTGTRSGRWLPIRRPPGGLLRAGRLYVGCPLRGLLSEVLSVGLLGVGLLGPPLRTGDPGLRASALRIPA